MKEKIIPRADIKIIGFGNIFMSDDAAGIIVIEQLKSIIDNIEIIDGGTSASDLIIQAKNSKKLVIVDAVDAGQGVGEIVKFNLKDIKEFKEIAHSYSLHDFNLSQALSIIDKLKIDIELVIIGIKPKKVLFGEGLSSEVKEKIPDIVDMVLKEVSIAEC
jgi:hydrogenase maturation protease